MAKRTKEQQEAINAKAKATREANKEANTVDIPKEAPPKELSPKEAPPKELSPTEKVIETLLEAPGDVFKTLVVVSDSRTCRDRYNAVTGQLTNQGVKFSGNVRDTEIHLDGVKKVKWICKRRYKEGMDTKYNEVIKS